MIFLLGGKGFVGSGFARQLQRDGRPVEIITRENYRSYVGRSCDVLINANGNSKKFLAKEQPKDDFQASVASVRNSLIDFEFKKYVFLSTSDIYPDCSSPALTGEDRPIDVAVLSAYGCHKYLAELCVRHGAEDWLIVRQGGFVGPGLKKNAVFDVLYGDRLWVHPDSRFQFIHTDASARLVLTLMDRGLSREIVNIAAAGTVSITDVMTRVGRHVPHDPQAVPVHYEIATGKAAALVDLPSSASSIERYLTDLAWAAPRGDERP